MDSSWDLYRTFVAVLRTGSLSGAARSLGLTQPTVGRHIEALEEEFGTLFVRSHTGFDPTELALRLRGHAESLESDVAALKREATYDQSSHTGTVRITASEVVGSEVLPPLLLTLNARYPRIAIELTLSDLAENLLARQADIAIRMFEPRQQALIAKKIGDIEVGLHARKSYFGKNGYPKKIEDLRKHTLIGFDTETEFIRGIQKKLGGALQRSDFILRTDSNSAYISAIRSGFGIGFCQVGLAKQYGDLERVLAKEIGFEMGTWIVMHENLRSNLCCLAVFNHLRDGLSNYVASAKGSRN